MKRRKRRKMEGMPKQKKRKTEMTPSHLLNHSEFLKPKWMPWVANHSFNNKKKKRLKRLKKKNWKTQTISIFFNLLREFQ